MTAFLLFLFSTFTSTPSASSLYRVEVADLAANFKVFENGKYVPIREASAGHQAIHVYLDVDKTKGNFLEVSTRIPLSLLINGQLVSRFNKSRTFSLDSLADIYSSAMSVTFYRSDMKTNPVAKIVSFTSVLPASTDPMKRRVDRFADFLILGSVFLFITFIVLLRANSRLMLDYLKFIKLFSRQERDENLGGAKISGSFNVLIYLFACFLIAIVLLTIHHHSGQSLSFIGDFKEDRLGAIVILWVSLALTLFIGLFIKLVVLYLFSILFDFTDILTLQFLNFIRVIFFGACATVLALLFYLVFDISGNGAYMFLFRMLIGMLLLWLPLVFFKLLNRTSNRMFHLFSYLCPSEIFPVLVLIKVLFL